MTQRAQLDTSTLSGLEFITAINRGDLPPAPMATLLGMSIVEVEAGRVVFALQPTLEMFNPIGMVHGGVAATMLDSCMGCAVHTTLPADVAYTTTDVQVRYLRSLPVDQGLVYAEGTVVHSGRSTATAEGRITNADGKVFAHGTTGCLVMRP